MNFFGLDDEEQLKDGLTPGSSTQAAPAPSPDSFEQPKLNLADMQPRATPTPLSAFTGGTDNHGMSAALPEKSANPAPQVTNVPRRTLPGMPSNITSDDLPSYVNQNKVALKKFGPQQQMDLENHLINQRNGLGYQLADAGKGFADALMQGVAGAGNPGWQKQFEDQNMAQGAEQMGVMQKAHEEQGQDTEQGMKLDMMNVKSPLSKSMQQAAAPIFQMMGISPQQVARMPASQIETIATLGLKSEDIKMQGELKKLLIQFDAVKEGFNVQNQQAERRQADTNTRLAHPILNALGKIPPPTSGNGIDVGGAAPHGPTVRQNGKLYTWDGSKYAEKI